MTVSQGPTLLAVTQPFTRRIHTTHSGFTIEIHTAEYGVLSVSAELSLYVWGQILVVRNGTHHNIDINSNPFYDQII